ncbi:E3 ubiquitin-protein ligase ATL42-like [Humulus lupulus]|uniref:E3 ubiquitin-protein ligase ATL42-like n=1 Tax=Humulus lupulus TaxID=3486 RepID=UPI002B4039F4|nr:E3 ubiquitin-protein ligase ATL42-like [Humulus lupulus]
MMRVRGLVKFQTFNLIIPMNPTSIIIILQLIFFNFDHVKAQTVGPDFAGPDNTDFQPSLAVVIGILSVMFVLTFFLLAYAKFCHRRESAVLLNRNQNQNQIGTSNRFSGIDKTVVESLPFFRFSSLKGSKEGLECSVCLSKFEDIEVLRLLPKCKHAFHISCIDYWLEKHSSCPLCRQKVSSEDLELITYSSSMRFLWNNYGNNSTNQSELGEDSNMELFVQREESRRGSSRFSIGSSFRKIEKGIDDGHDHHDQPKEEQMLIQSHNQKQVLHKHNHKIVVSDFVFKNRWSNVSSSDLIFLNSEMLNDMSSTRFVSPNDSNRDLSLTIKTEENDEITKIKEEMGMKRSFENKVGTTINNNNITSSKLDNNISSSSVMSCGEQRSVSEITAHSRYGVLGSNSRLRRESSLTTENNVKEERIRRAWLNIAKKTVRWFANREERSQESQNQNLHRSNV